MKDIQNLVEYNGGKIVSNLKGGYVLMLSPLLRRKIEGRLRKTIASAIQFNDVKEIEYIIEVLDTP